MYMILWLKKTTKRSGLKIINAIYPCLSERQTMQFFPPILFQPVRLQFLTNLPTNTFIPTSTTIPDFRVFLFFLHIPIFFHIFPGFNFLLNASLKILKAIVSLSQFHGMSSIVLVISHNLLQGLYLLASIMLYKQNSKDQNCPWKPYSNS